MPLTPSLPLPQPPAPVGLRRVGALLLAALGAASCASYPERQEAALRDLRSGRLEEAASSFEDSTDGFLGAVEPGTVRFVAGDWQRAQDDLLRAAEIVERLEDRAPVGAASAAEGLGTLLLNESASAYTGEGFEHVQVHALLAQTFLAQGRLQDALVEARRANQRLEREEELYDVEYAAGGLGHFISALSYELLGDPGDALIDYRRMDEKGLAPTLVGPELTRLASLLRREDLLPELEERFGPAPAVPPDSARLVLIAGVGLAPFKAEEALRLATPAGIVAWAVPAYVERDQPIAAVDLVVASHDQRVRSTVIEDVGAVAQANLADRIGLLAARSAVRATSRTVAAKQLRDSDQHGAALVVDLFSVFTERADRRSWLTLPDTWQVAQVFLPAGPLEVAVEAVGGARVDFGRIALEPGETALIFARTIDQTLHAHLVGGADAATAAP